MISSATRSRLFELRRDRASAERSAELLDRKREVLLREIARRERLRIALRVTVGEAYADARQKLRIARVELGMPAIEAAAKVQKPRFSIASRSTSVMGVRIPQLAIEIEPYRACYSAAETAASLDDAGAAYSALLAQLVQLAQEETAVARLALAMRKTTKLLNALRKVVLPRIEHEIRMAVEGIEEEERDEAVRRRCGAGLRPAFGRGEGGGRPEAHTTR